MKTSELTGAALDWAVAKCFYTDRFFEPTEGRTAIRVLRSPDYTGEYHSDWFMFRPSTDWAQGGPIIDREGVTLTQYDDYPNWSATLYATDYNEHTHVTAPTPLIAAMRCYVASKLGDDINIPEELL